MPRKFNTDSSSDIVDPTLTVVSSNTCRNRKLKCDEAYPICSRCLANRRHCDRSERPPRQQSVAVDHYEAAGMCRFIALAKRLSADRRSDDSPRRALESSRIAGLFRHYISNVSEWYDLSDTRCHFSQQLPILALDNILLFKAILALAAIHISQTSSPSVRSMAEKYHGQCIRLLINLDVKDPSIKNGVALATTCLLRSYEILSEDRDPNRHLQGAFSLASELRTISSSAPEQLLWSGFWNYLREDITFSLFTDCRLKIELDAIDNTPSPLTDRDQLNEISLILGQIINATVGDAVRDTDCDLWESLLASLERWQANLPRHIAPFSRAPVATLSRLPTVQMLADCHAAAYHYYLVSLAMLATCAPSPARFEDLKSVSSRMGMVVDGIVGGEDLLENIASEICGVAFTSNEPSVLVNAFGPIAFCAKNIRQEATQQEVLSHLSASRKTTGWPTDRMVSDLKRHWASYKSGST
ncbi:hypothetical protein F5Y18DRAFT_414509 [Xylariaceae sp. FL1019]|nr:hypothetical protein F5Y18DRAFT_414509 [Xylariaceae sp. FL1019]